MKKITILLCFLLFINFSFLSNAQCNFDAQYPGDITLTNNGYLESIDGCNSFGEYSVLVGLIDGDEYEFSADGGFITIIDNADGSTVLASGASPLIWTATETTIQTHWAADTACGTNDDCHATSVINNSIILPPPPANDECVNAISLAVNSDLTCSTTISGTVLGATDSSVDFCDGEENDDVWYSFIATGTTHAIELSNTVDAGGDYVDLRYAIYDAASGCGTLGTPLICSDSGISIVLGLTLGNTYYVQVYTSDSLLGSTGTFDICVGTPPPPPANDECTNAIALTVNSDRNCDVVTSGTTLSATSSGVDFCDGTENDDVWYSFVATGTAHAIELSNTVDIGGDYVDLWYAVYDATSGCGTLGTSLICSDTNNSTVLGLTSGNTYYVQAYTLDNLPGSTATFDICIGTPPPPPANDECTNAIALTVNSDSNCDVVTSGTLTSATDSGVDNCDQTVDDDVWFSFVATENSHPIELSNVVGDYTDLYHIVYDAMPGCDALGTPIVCSDPDTSLASGLTPGNTYFVQVFTWSQDVSATTTFDICIKIPPPPPTNDECADAIPLTINTDLDCNLVVSGTVTSATNSGIDNCDGTEDDDVWYSFVATDNIHVISMLNITGSSFSISYSVYDAASGCGTLGTPLACSGISNDPVTGLTPGNTYFVQVYTSTDVPGQTTTFDICIGTLPPPPVNDTFAGAIPIVPSTEGTGCDTASFTLPFITDGTRDSGMDGSCDNEYTGLDQFFTWTATSTGLIWNTLFPGYPGIVIWDETGTIEIACAKTYVDTPLSGWAIGQNLVIQIYALDPPGTTAVSNLDFCLEEYTIPPVPVNDDCLNAINITQETNIVDATNATPTQGTIGSATDSGVTAPFCDSGRGIANDDVWYSFTALTSDVNITIEPLTAYNGVIVVELFDACNGTSISCDDSSVGITEIQNTNLTIGSSYIVRIFNLYPEPTITPSFNLKIWSSSTLSITNFDIDLAITYYPNPVKNLLSLNAQKEIKDITVYNIFGQEVLKVSLNTLSGEINMSDLNSGNYFVKVNINNTIKTIRVIKE